MAETFQDFIARDRERLHGEREAIFTQQQQLQEKLDAINNEMRAIDAYEAAKSGKAPAPRQAAARRGQPRAHRGSKREQLLELIKNNPHGLARKDILEHMGLKGNKAGEMSVSNALTALTKANQVARREGKYVAA